MFSNTGDIMVNMTISIPGELKDDLDLFPEINWSEVARQAFKEKIADLKFLLEFKKNSTMTEDEAVKLGKELNKSLHKRYSENH
jgi:hypothetical protein